MADSTITGLTSATALGGSELLEIVQGGNGRKVTATRLLSETIVASSAKGTPVDADSFGLVDSAASNALKETTWANIKAAMVFPVVIHCRVSATYATAVAATTNQFYYRATFGFTLTEVVATLVTAQATNGGGGILTVDVHDDGTTVFSTKVTIDNTELTSRTAVTPSVINAGTIANNSVLTIDVDQIGDGTAAGLDVYLIGTRTA